MLYSTDDLCLSNLKYFEYWDKLKILKPNLKVIAFTIANFENKENVRNSKEFNDWWELHKNWVEIAVHGYDHLYPPEAERDDFEEQVTKALEILRPYLPKNYGYRSPGFKFTIRMEPLLKKLGFSYVAYQNHIKYFKDNSIKYGLINTHCCDKFENPITKVWSNL